MICDECETVAHCLKNGCVPKQPSKDEVLKLALEALEEVRYYGRDQTERDYDARTAAITAVRKALAEAALDRMAENARELGLDYESAPSQYGSPELQEMIVARALEKDCAAQPAPVQEPVAYCDLENWLRGKVWADDVFSNIQHKGWSPLYTNPPAAQRQWVGLTPDDIRQLEKENTVGGLHGDYCPTWDLIESVEAKLKEKNT
jgi:hypothetical protein